MAKGQTVTVGCKLPNGIILNHPLQPNLQVELKGRNKALIVGADHATTEVDGDFMDAWMAVHKEFPAVKNGAIFVARKAEDVAAIAKEYAARKTGLEPMKKDAIGVKPAEK